ncbi:hypothetical protein [Halobacillus mangrovi]|uniref:hypothetical protein n=1 Tax=Halobacillus mangrovi TaxID=402384 RepID=UPI003D97D908
MKRKLKYLCSLICTVLLFSAFSLAFGQSVNASETIEQPLLEEELFSENGDFIKFLKGVENLPYGIEKQGAEKVAKWLTNKTGVEVIAEDENLLIPSLANVNLGSDQHIGNVNIGSDQTTTESTVTTMGTWSCITAVGLMIGTVGFPLSKILKLKKAISLLGGVTKTVERIYEKYKLYRSWNYTRTYAWKRAVSKTSSTLGSDVRYAFLDFFNITNVINQCT